MPTGNSTVTTELIQGNQPDEFEMTSLDHGMLNIPLSKRGNIDAQIDRYNADMAAEAKAARKVREAQIAALRIEAKALLANVEAARVEYLASRFGITKAQMRSKLKSDAHWLPAQVITLLTPKAA